MALKISKYILAFVISIAPLSALAAVSMTEVMYDAPGSDSGHEWIEIANTGAEPVSIAGYKLAEGGTNHGITAVQGTSTLAAGEVAVLANNPADFSQDFPAYSGALFKSSFSLSNAGEEIVLKDASLKPVDSLTYDSTMGAGGDGNSLHLQGSQWVPGAPNPGSLAATIALVKPASTPPAAKKSSTQKSSSNITFGTENGAQSAAVADSAAGAGDAPAVSSDTASTLWEALLGLGALIIVGMGAVVYMRSAPPAVAPDVTAQDFTIE